MPRTLAANLVLDRRQLLLGLSAAAALAAVRPLRAQETRTVEHALGTATVTAKPLRVLVLSDFTDLEYTLALGVTPIAYGFTGAWERGGLPWQNVADLEQLPLVEGVPSPEVVATYEPDLIIGMSSYIEPVLAQLEGVAPVIALDWSMPWRDGLAIVSRALFAEEAAETAIAETRALMASTAADLAGLGGKKIMIGSLYGDTLYVIGAGPIAEQFAELGLTFVPAPNAGDSGLAEFSIENVDILAEADILLSFASDPEATARLEAFAPFQRLPAVAGHAYIPLDTITGSAFADNFSPLSAQWVLPRLAELLKQAAAGEA
jgi:iron complex transport system substrate-binding protein